jgi:hypothetical protein
MNSIASPVTYDTIIMGKTFRNPNQNTGQNEAAVPVDK